MCLFIIFSDFLIVKDDGEAPPAIDTKDPLNKALSKSCRSSLVIFCYLV